MSSIFSTQNRQTFLRRKYCFFPTAAALSPPVGRCEAAIGLPPLCSAMFSSPSLRWVQRPRLARRVLDEREPPEQWGRRVTDARLPPRRPASAVPARVAAPRPAADGARASHAPSSVS